MDAGNLTSSINNLNTLKYAGLQELAKKCGLKANLKAEKLRDSLRIHLTKSDKINAKETNLVANQAGNDRARRIRRRTFELEEAAMGALTPEILQENQVHEHKRLINEGEKALASSREQNPPQIKWKLIDDENKPPVSKSDQIVAAGTSSSLRKRVALRPQRVLRKTQDQSKIPRPSRVATDAAISKKTTPNFARMHKRIFDKMDSVDVYVEKKRFRAKQLQNGMTPTSPAKKPEPTVKRAIFSPAAKRGIFAPTVFSVKEANFNFAKNAPIKFSAASKIPIKKPSENLSLATKKPRTDHRQMYKTRKSKNEIAKGKLHQYVKGVRTNRRFDLQMQMRSAAEAT